MSRRTYYHGGGACKRFASTSAYLHIANSSGNGLALL